MERSNFAPGAVLVDRYRIEGELGRGSMGVVLRARHVVIDTPVAIKVRDDGPSSAFDAHRMMTAASLGSLIVGPHVVEMRDFGPLEGEPDATYLVMELVEGRDLARYLREEGPLSVQLVATLGQQICAALAVVSSHAVVHRDLKPSHLLLGTAADGTPHLKLFDFGLARRPTITEFPSDEPPGTPAYMAPEQWRSWSTVDRRADLWSLGVILYELVEGRRPFDRDRVEDLRRAIEHEPHAPFHHAPAALGAVIARCLHKSPDERFQSAAELAASLLPFAVASPG